MDRDGTLMIEAFEATSHAVMITDAEGNILAVNPAFREVTGWASEEVIGQAPRWLQSGRQDLDFFETMWHALLTKGSWQGEIWNRHRDGQAYPEFLTIDGVRSARGEISHFIGVFSDAAGREARKDHLVRLAYQDALTELPNRTLFFDRLEQAVSLVRRKGGEAALLLLDLDNFDKANSTFGHDAGDLVLKAVAKRLRDAVRESDTVARLDGDEFGVILPVIEGAKGAREAAQRIQTALDRPFSLAGDKVKLGASIGIALFPADGTNAQELVEKADSVMHWIKRRGKGAFAFFEDALEHKPLRRRAAG